MFDAEQLRTHLAGGLETPLPRMVRVRQDLPKQRLDNVAGVIEQQLDQLPAEAEIRPGASIAVGVGSRGIDQIETIVRAVVEGIKRRGGKPFIFPAMGSHGGATAVGQEKLLADYGVTAERVGAPIRATMETVVAAHLEGGDELHADRYAAAADGIVLINRIKPHSTFRGAYQSGLIKMLVIGTGKVPGATMMHQHFGMDRFAEILPAAATALLAKLPVLFGVALVEDAADQTALAEVVPSAEFVAREPGLLKQATDWMGRLYFDSIDVVVIDQIGKEVSGSGFDPNVVGRNSRGVAGFDRPRVQKVVVLDLSEQTRGNATGVGLADVVTRRLLERTDFSATYANVITSAYLDGAAIPIVMETAADAVRLAIKTTIGAPPEKVRLVRIRDTKSLHEIEVSEAMLGDVQQHPQLHVLSSPRHIPWDSPA